MEWPGSRLARLSIFTQGRLDAESCKCVVTVVPSRHRFRTEFMLNAAKQRNEIREVVASKVAREVMPK